MDVKTIKLNEMSNNTVLGDKLQEALNTKKNNIETYVWKGPREEGSRNQVTMRMVDATPEQLKEWYKHCQSMLYSNDKKFPGRYVLRDIVDEQRSKCNVELCLRWLENKYMTNIPEPRPAYLRHLYLQDLMDILRNSKEVTKEEYSRIPISAVKNGINMPMEFRDVTIDQIISGCLDTLGVFSREHISLRFITKLGVWFTDKEMNELTEKDKDGNIRNRIDVIKERHNLKSVITLRPNSKGLKYSELRAMLNLKTKKYSELTTDQLVTLRNKVLFRFQEEIDFHISQWEKIIDQLEAVANSKGFSLINN